MKIAFLAAGLTLRGSEVAVRDYARGAREILGAEVLLAVRWQPDLEHHPVMAEWRREFPCVVHRGGADLSRQLQERGVQVLYEIKPGRNDGLVVPGVRHCVHAMFPETEFHGDRYVYVSRWLSRVMTGREDRYVPHLVPRLVSGETLRPALGIPAGARVFGRHGGEDTFNLPFVHEAVRRHARRHPEDHFVFLNTRTVPGTEGLANVHYLPGTADPGAKASFLATCDGMLHARRHGETFGLAVGEFAVLGKRVLTYGHSRERAHLEMLGPQAGIYTDRPSLEQLLRDFQPGAVHGTEYEHHADVREVMARFRACFLD